MKTKFNFFDAVLVAALLAAAAFLFLAKSAGVPKGASSSVQIISGGVAMGAALPLGDDAVFRLREGFVVEIKDSRVRILSSDCPKKICEHSGWISRRGESLVCAPNKIAVSIISGDTDYDAIAR